MSAALYRRRAALYLAVLMTAMIVTVLGVAGLLATRIQVQSSGHTLDASAARFYAESAIDVALMKLSSAPNWYTVINRGQWSAEIHVGQGTLSWRFETDQGYFGQGTPPDVVRLYGRGTCGQALRIYSVLVQACDEAVAMNLLTNGDFENGTSSWSSSGCNLVTDTCNPHAGDAAMRVRDRHSSWDGPYQDIIDELTEGDTYTFEVWLRMASSSEGVEIVLWVDADHGWESMSAGSGTVGTNWTQLTGSFTPTWSGSADNAVWGIQTSSSNQNFYVDDALILPAGGLTTTNAIAVPGTWRRETADAVGG
ncbi:MAG: carbohydrate binding domain-containing protein [Phycisphaerae bacterium]|jgi:hypothetical protein